MGRKLDTSTIEKIKKLKEPQGSIFLMKEK